MRKAALLYNPLSGGRRERRLGIVEAVLGVLRAAGVEVACCPTRGSAEAGDQARQAISEGCDTVLACGGDGTIHDVLQGMVGSSAALGIIPLGTANTLAHDLQIPLHPVPAARAALDAEPRRFGVGNVEFRGFDGSQDSRYFTVAVGIGVDAHLFYKLNQVVKGRLGMIAYYAKATQLWLTHAMQYFDAEFVELPGPEPKHVAVSELLAVRITQFGGVLRELAPGASLRRDDLRLVLFRTSNRFCYLAYILRGLLGRRWRVPGIELRSCQRVSCTQLAEPDCAAERGIYVEADGELVGRLPAEISVIPDAITLLVPRGASQGLRIISIFKNI